MKKFLLLISAILIFGCDSKEESIDFLAPQPVDVKNISSFNRKYQGSYYNEKKNAELLITKDKIIKIRSVSVEFTRDNLQESFPGNKLNDDELIRVLAKEDLKVVNIKGDSIKAAWTMVDTIFEISDQNIARHYRGSYFLNYTNDRLTWKVQRLDLSKNRLAIGMIMPDDSLFAQVPVKVKSKVSDDKSIVADYQIKPSKSELKKLIKADYFKDWEVWIKKD